MTTCAVCPSCDQNKRSAAISSDGLCDECGGRARRLGERFSRAYTASPRKDFATIGKFILDAVKEEGQ